MKKLLSAFVLAALVVATPAVANDRHRDDRVSQHRYEHRDARREHRHDRNRGDGVFVGVLAGVVLGAILQGNSNRDRYYDDRYYYRNDVYPERYCYEMRHVDRYGRVISTFDCR